MEDHPSPRHTAALELTARGIRIVPCRVGGKEPVIEQGFKKRSADPEQISKWWAEADYNLGVCPADLGCVALDLDLYKKDGVSKAILDMLPPTRTHSSPQGGRHLLYRTDALYSNRKFAVNVDLRCANGYIMWPPSVYEGKEYTIIDPRGPVPFPPAIAATLHERDERADACDMPDIGLDVYLDRAEEWCRKIAENDAHPGRFQLAASLVRNFGLTNKTSTELCEKYGLRMTPHKSGTSWEATLKHARK